MSLANNKARQIFRWFGWEKIRFHPTYRSDIYDMNEQVSSGKIDDVAQVLDLLYEFGRKWKISYPIDPDTEWEAIEDKAHDLFINCVPDLLGYSAIRKPLEPLFGKGVFLSGGFSPPLRLPSKWQGKNSRLSSKWEVSFRAYHLCEIEGRKEEDVARIIKAESKGKTDLAVQAIHEMKKRVYELVYGEPFPSKRERRKKQFKDFAPCADCVGEMCRENGEVCAEMERWFENVVTLPPHMTPHRTHEVKKDGTNIVDAADHSRAMREMAAYQAFPSCIFKNLETGDSFAYHSPEAVKVYFHVPRLRLNWIFIGREDDFSLPEDSTNFDKR